MAKKQGWHHESVRHALARKCISTATYSDEYNKRKPLINNDIPVSCKQCGGPNPELRSTCQYCGSILNKSTKELEQRVKLLATVIED
jgi:hypothetical protein